MKKDVYSKKTIDFAQEQERILNKLLYRETKCKETRTQGRNLSSKDYARILYSSSFRRLQGKMQLLGINSSNFTRNRLTHSLEVAQIARSIAYNLGLKEVIFSESCSLAHDLGNPPFGHYGEVILNNLAKDYGGYEGNAQTFRILRKLEKKHYEYEGLNLTLRTLFGVTKYFYTKKENDKKFLYDEDYDFLKTELNKHQISITKSIDAQIMDLADEIAYAAHDLEDALSIGIISLGEMVHEFKISEKYMDAFKDFSKIVKKVQNIALKSTKLETSEEYSAVLRKELTSTIVHDLCIDIDIVEKNNIKQLGFKTKQKLSEGLKKLLFNAILRKKDIQHYEKKGEKIIKGLYEVYTDTTYNKNNILLPAEYRKRSDKQERLVIDYISGMMDSFAEQEYIKYFGKSEVEKLYFK
ncbi:dGTP triphosphohydrolase [Aliarcobacter butzleri]|uniref:dGTP triphosphohydrolase n=1 Tax=Aliarcobacter butzleri TaxID=28197 RepID=UPI001261365F|nr:dNTP triphosphohydrolase [Aliarcobacter butzleri]MCT7552770.1 dNTP triphosphohydrolase [Aliarcobacter butzleri]MCT7576520.1 dNTP triphosphohydrolase [Aliarcobacter butzleri]MCT7591627.1 dNTP triphosphohydrolase [Aliarcobacter butzleri]MCT7630274.1 dNTP triphosphohydrolase [Aliarcobacter butzleri]MDN5125530.1 dNTP triphosphohydrolase [Aliarcobacter butzleri]